MHRAMVWAKAADHHGTAKAWSGVATEQATIRTRNVSFKFGTSLRTSTKNKMGIARLGLNSYVFGSLGCDFLECDFVGLHTNTQIYKKNIVERFSSDGVFCVFVIFWWFCWPMGHTNAQMRKCTDSCSGLIDWSSKNPRLASLIEIAYGRRTII
jgi:hypothetical protein